MKLWKKFSALFLALVMVLALAILTAWVRLGVAEEREA